LNFLFNVIHKKIKETVNFATRIKYVAKNAFCCEKFIKFLRNPAMLKEWKAKNLGIVQLDIFKKKGVFFENTG
jgi:hypothetical protein